MKKIGLWIATSLTATLLYAHTEPAMPATKSYTLVDLQSVVSNSEHCAPFYEALKQLSEKPVVLEFKKNGHKRTLEVHDHSGQLSHHRHTTLKQKGQGKQLNRMGTGTFEFNHEKMDYLISISANVDNPNYQYLYPIILTSHQGQCYYTALVKPSEETVAAFKRKVASGAAAKGADLAH